MLLEKYGASCQLAEYRESKQSPAARFNGVMITGSPQGDDIVEQFINHLVFRNFLTIVKRSMSA